MMMTIYACESALLRTHKIALIANKVDNCME